MMEKANRVDHLSAAPPKRVFSAIEGVRCLVNFWIVCLHSNTMISYCSGASNVDKPILIGYFNAPWKPLVVGLMSHVDIFFMLSGFLLSFQLLASQSRKALPQSGWEKSIFPRTFGSIIERFFKRYFRLMPGMLCSAVFSHFVSDLGSQSLWTLIIGTSTFTSRFMAGPISLLVVWSNAVEIMGSILITAVVLLFGRYLVNPSRGYTVAASLFAVSILPRFLCLYLYPEFSTANLVHQPNQHLPRYMTSERVAWLQEHYSAAQALPLGDENEFRLGWFRSFYVPWWSRMGPFFIGLGLAVAIFRINQTDLYLEKHKLSANSKNMLVAAGADSSESAALASPIGDGRDKRSAVRPHYEYSAALHWVLSSLASVALLLPVLFSLIACFKLPVDPTATIPLDHPPPSFCFINIFSMIIAQPLITFGVAYMLYRCMLPPGHPLHLRMLNSMLSLPVLRPLAELSYTIYILHFRILLDVLFWLLPLGYLDSVLGPQRGVAHLLVVSAATYILTAGLAYVVYHGAEKHMQKAGARLIAAVQSYIGPSNDSSRKVSTGKAGRDKQL